MPVKNGITYFDIVVFQGHLSGIDMFLKQIKTDVLVKAEENPALRDFREDCLLRHAICKIRPLGRVKVIIGNCCPVKMVPVFSRRCSRDRSVTLCTVRGSA